ncbi:MAG TPA: hypothetical protein VF857_03320 [Spirochaetota bacterium]
MEQHSIIDRLPFFSPLDDVERSEIRRLFYEMPVSVGDKVDSKNGDILYFIKDGFFQSEGALQKSETIYLSRGSMIGSLPFAANPARGSIKAVSPAVLYAADKDSLYRFFLSRFPAMRGYMRILNRSGVPLSASGKNIVDRMSRIITVCGHVKGAGKTVSALYLSRLLSESGSVVICDLSTTGLSLFDYCRKKLTPPVAQKKAGEQGDDYFRDRITELGNNISLLNFSFGSNVMADASLLSPLLYYLSSRYRYILFDLDGYDDKLEKEAVTLSDFVIPVCRTAKDITREEDRYSMLMEQGQTLVPMLREGIQARVGSDALRISVPNILIDEQDGKSAIFDAAYRDGNPLSFLTTERTYHRFASQGLISLCFAGLLPHIESDLKNGSIMYANSFAFALLSSMFCGAAKDFISRVRSSFREEKIDSLVEYTYPGNHLIKSEPIVRWAAEISGLMRLEHLPSTLSTSVVDGNNVRTMSSTGLIRDRIASTMSPVPLCSFVKTAGGLRGSGVPINGSYFFRHPVGKAVFYAVNNDGEEFSGRRIESALKFGFAASRTQDGEKWLYDKNIIIDVNLKRFNIKKIISDTEKLWESSLSSQS